MHEIFNVTFNRIESLIDLLSIVLHKIPQEAAEKAAAKEAKAKEAAAAKEEAAKAKAEVIYFVHAYVFVLISVKTFILNNLQY